MNNDQDDEFPNLFSARTLAAAVFMVFIAVVLSHFFPLGFGSPL